MSPLRLPSSKQTLLSTKARKDRGEEENIGRGKTRGAREGKETMTEHPRAVLRRGRKAGVSLARKPVMRLLFEAIAATGLSDGEIAYRAGFAPPVLSNLRRGHRDGNIATLTALAGAIGLEVRLAPLPERLSSK